MVFPYESVYIGLIKVWHRTPEGGPLDIDLAVTALTLIAPENHARRQIPSTEAWLRQHYYNFPGEHSCRRRTDGRERNGEGAVENVGVLRRSGPGCATPGDSTAVATCGLSTLPKTCRDLMGVAAKKVERERLG
jgi:hypothetical protein